MVSSEWRSDVVRGPDSPLTTRHSLLNDPPSIREGGNWRSGIRCCAHKAAGHRLIGLE
jgi:hypothetical protein